MYHTAYFGPTEREALVYQRFGELLEAITGLVKENYHGVSAALATELSGMTTRRLGGFGTTEITSVAKTVLVAKLQALSSSLSMTGNGSVEKVA